MKVFFLKLRESSFLFLIVSWTFLLGLMKVSAFAQCMTNPDSTLVQRVGQGDSLLTFEQRLTTFPWIVAKDLITLTDAGLSNYGEVGLNYHLSNGSLKRPQEPQAVRRYGLDAKGYHQLRNWHFYGEFGYHPLQRDGLQYANVARPYLGNPFITADSIGGNWRADQLKGMLQIGYPAAGPWFTSTFIDYLTETGSRGNDPRPLYRYLDAHVGQSIGYRLDRSTRLSLKGTFRRLTETIETGYGAGSNSKLFSLRGYGTYDYVPVVSAERYVNGKEWKGNVLFINRQKRSLWLAGAGLTSLSQEVEEGTAIDPLSNYPKALLVGRYDEMMADFYVAYQRLTKKGGWSLRGNAEYRKGQGFDPRFNGVNAERLLWEGRAEASYWQQGKENRRWRVTYQPQISYLNHYEFMSGTDWHVLSFVQHLRGSWDFFMRKAKVLSFSPLMGYHFPLEKNLFVERPTVISHLLTFPDFAFISNSFVLAGLEASISFPVSGQRYRIVVGYQSHTNVQRLHRQKVDFAIQLVF